MANSNFNIGDVESQINTLSDHVANNLTFLKISGTLGNSGTVETIYTHSTSLSGYMIAGWNVILSNVKYQWQGTNVIDSIRIDGSSVKVKTNTADVNGATIEILLYKIPT